MRSISFIVAAIVLASPSVAGSSPSSSQGNLPGIGTFSYSGSPVEAPAPVLLIAGLTKADRS